MDSAIGLFFLCFNQKSTPKYSLLWWYIPQVNHTHDTISILNFIHTHTYIKTLMNFTKFNIFLNAPKKKIFANWFITFLANALKMNLRWNRWKYERSTPNQIRCLYIHYSNSVFVHLSNPRTHSRLSDGRRENSFSFFFFTKND